MPPHALVHEGIYPSSIREDRTSIEIETKEQKNGKLVISNISFVTVDEERTPSFTSFVTLDSNANTLMSDDESSVVSGNNLKLANEMDSNMSENFYVSLTEQFLYPCGNCGMDEPATRTIKSALKKDGGRSLKNSRNHSVQFKSLEIREHQMTLGDHPAASSGPPVTLDWSPSREHVVDLEAYERARSPRRSRRQLRMSYQTRERVLLDDLGFSVDEVKKAWTDAMLIRKQRYETLMQSVFSTQLEEAWESAGRKFWRMFNYE